MCATSREHCSKASILFNAVDSPLTKEGLDWGNVVSLGLDNMNSNIGNKNSAKFRVLEKNLQCFIPGCNCHLAHLAAGKGGSPYSNIFGFDCEEYQVDIYYFFKGGSRLKGILTEFLDFTSLEWENFVRYVKTWWLSLEQCCHNEIKKFCALKFVFLSRVEKEIINR